MRNTQQKAHDASYGLSNLFNDEFGWFHAPAAVVDKNDHELVIIFADAMNAGDDLKVRAIAAPFGVNIKAIVDNNGTFDYADREIDPVMQNLGKVKAVPDPSSENHYGFLEL